MHRRNANESRSVTSSLTHASCLLVSGTWGPLSFLTLPQVFKKIKKKNPVLSEFANWRSCPWNSRHLMSPACFTKRHAKS